MADLRTPQMLISETEVNFRNAMPLKRVTAINIIFILSAEIMHLFKRFITGTSFKDILSVRKVKIFKSGVKCANFALSISTSWSKNHTYSPTPLEDNIPPPSHNMPNFTPHAPFLAYFCPFLHLFYPLTSIYLLSF
jgi:hypothetical protein